MIERNQVSYLLENMQPDWLSKKEQRGFEVIIGVIEGLFAGLVGGLVFGWRVSLILGAFSGWLCGLFYPIFFLVLVMVGTALSNRHSHIEMADTIVWNWKKGMIGIILGAIGWLTVFSISSKLGINLRGGLYGGLSTILYLGLVLGLKAKQIDQTAYPGHRISNSLRSTLLVFVSSALVVGITACLGFSLEYGLTIGLLAGLWGGLFFLGFTVIQHYVLRFMLITNNSIPYSLIPFLDHCVDLIFLRRVGGGYIFVHRLLMEHFAEMCVDTPTSKGN